MSIENSTNNFSKDMVMHKIREELLKSLNEYRNSLKYMCGDAPIAVLCLPKKIEKILLSADLLRVYDLFDRDFTEIEGLNDAAISELTARLDEFLSMF